VFIPGKLLQPILTDNSLVRKFVNYEQKSFMTLDPARTLSDQSGGVDLRGQGRRKGIQAQGKGATKVYLFSPDRSPRLPTPSSPYDS
jgi:hypothetical protein